MYLSRLILNTRLRAVRFDLADCQALHRTVMSAFPQARTSKGPRADLGVLYHADTHRRTGQVALIVQSLAEPDWSKLKPGYLLNTGGDPENPACKRVGEQYRLLDAGMVMVFRLRANPTRKIDTRTGQDGQRRHGKRVELRGEAAQVDWLRRKGEQGGFQLLAVRTDPSIPNVRASAGGKLVGERPSGSIDLASRGTSRLTFASVLFEGKLRVTDADKFRDALEHGIGPGKAYGFGLLSIAPLAR